MVRMRGRARLLMPRNLAAPGKLPTGPVSRDRRASETAHTPQSRHTRLPRAVCSKLRPDGPHRTRLARRGEKRCGSILPIRSSIAAMCFLARTSPILIWLSRDVGPVSSNSWEFPPLASSQAAQNRQCCGAPVKFGSRVGCGGT